MTKDTLYRAAAELTTEGRTLLGVAMPWDTPALVRDPGKAPYLEAFARSAFDRSLEQRPEPRPLYFSHEYRVRPAAEPIGVANFQKSTDGLIFQAYVSRTRKGDEYLELVRDKAVTDASVGVFPVQQKVTRTPQGPLTTRTETGLLELSLASAGFGQYPAAKILAMRSAPDSLSFGDIGEAVSDALEAELFPTTGEEPADAWVCICDLSDNWAVYSIDGNVSEDAEGLWKVAYTMAADGTVTLGETVRVVMDYVPATGADAATGPAPGDAIVAGRSFVDVDPLEAIRLLRLRRGF